MPELLKEQKRNQTHRDLSMVLRRYCPYCGGGGFEDGGRKQAKMSEKDSMQKEWRGSQGNDAG